MTLLASLSAQMTQKNLDSSEEFLLGGPFGVRAYPVNEGRGDEVSGDAPWGALQLSASLDAGGVRVHDDPKGVAIPTATGKNHYPLSGWSVGMTLRKSDSHSLRFIWAGKIGDNPGRAVTGEDADERGDDSRFWLQGALWF